VPLGTIEKPKENVGRKNVVSTTLRAVRYAILKKYLSHFIPDGTKTLICLTPIFNSAVSH